MYDLISICYTHSACFPQAKTVLFYCNGVFIVIFFQTMYNKTIIRMVYAISRIIKVELSVNQPRPSPQLMNTYLDLDYSGYHKNIHPT